MTLLPLSPLFSHDQVRIDLLRQRAYNQRWATQGEDVIPLTAAGVRRVHLPIDKQSGTFDIDQLASLITPMTRMLCLCNPHNPLGRVLTREELTGIGRLAIEHDLIIMSDEVWCDIIYPPHQHISIGSLDPEIGARTVTVFGPSKGFGIAGLRIGFLVAPDAACLERLTRFSLEPLIIA